MKKAYLLAAVICGTGMAAGSIFTRLGIKEETARKFILNNIAADFSGGFSDAEEDHGGSENESVAEMKTFRIPHASLLPAIVKGDKTAAAKDLFVYIKTYVNSTEFAADYAAKRAKAMPTSEPWRPDDKTIRDTEEQLKKGEKDFAAASKYYPEDVNKKIKAGFVTQKKQLEEWKDPHPNKTRWEKMYPENPAILIKKRLEEYLQLAATVDFDARVTTGSRKKFVNPVYESKSQKWKAIYRAGKEVNATLTAFIKEWLKGPILSDTKTAMPLESTDDKTTGYYLNYNKLGEQTSTSPNKRLIEKVFA